MGEKKVVVRDLTLSYEGLFNLEELYYVMDIWMREKWWEKRERVHDFYDSPTGKQLVLDMEPWKKVTDYHRGWLKINVVAKDLKAVEVERDGKKIKVMKGKINFNFAGWLVTDYWGRWDNKPILFFMKTLFERYPLKMWHSKYTKLIRDDVYELYNTVKAFLNSQNYKFQMKEEGVKHGV